MFPKPQQFLYPDFLKNKKFVISRAAIRASGIKIFPAIMFDAKIKLITATAAPNNSCLFFDDGDVIGSGSITIEKKTTVGLRRVTENESSEMPKLMRLKIA